MAQSRRFPFRLWKTAVCTLALALFAAPAGAFVTVGGVVNCNGSHVGAGVVVSIVAFAYGTQNCDWNRAPFGCTTTLSDGSYSFSIDTSTYPVPEHYCVEVRNGGGWCENGTTFACINSAECGTGANLFDATQDGQQFTRDITLGYTNGCVNGGDACPFADVLTATGWQVGNSILGRSPMGSPTTDFYKLQAVPRAVDGSYEICIREDEQEVTSLNDACLMIIDHAPDVVSAVDNGQFFLGHEAPLEGVVSDQGMDVAAGFQGDSNWYFLGSPGTSLYIAPSTVKRKMDMYDEYKPHVRPLLPGHGSADEASVSAEIDRQVLSESGLLVQVPSDHDWTTVAQVDPRQYASQATVSIPANEPARILFTGTHRIDALRLFVASGDPITPTTVRAAIAAHSRLGDVAAMLSPTAEARVSIVRGDRLVLRFPAPTQAAGTERDIYLVARGLYTTVEALSERTALPGFALAQNYPNPFHGASTFSFTVPTVSNVRIDLFDVAGRKVTTVADGRYEAGTHAVVWSGKDQSGRVVASGTYIYRMTSGIFSAEHKMTVMP